LGIVRRRVGKWEFEIISLFLNIKIKVKKPVMTSPKGILAILENQ